MEHQSASRPPSLKTLCERIIFIHRDWLGDVGGVPIVLLEDCLHACSAQQLARIEDETSDGGVDISVDLAHHWKRCFERRFGSFDASKEEAPVLESAAQLSSSDAVDWRALYQWREEQYEAKLRASGERLRQRTAAESSGRDSRSIRVLSAVPRRPPAQKGFHCGSSLPEKAPGSRHRLLRKLGMSSSKQGPPAKRFRIIKRPSGALSNASKESRLAGSTPQLVESELDLTPSSSTFMPTPLGNTHPHNTPSMAPSASSGSQAPQMTDNRVVSQLAFEERLRPAIDRHLPKHLGHLPKTPGQLRASSDQGAAKRSHISAQTAEHGVKQAGHLEHTSRLGKANARLDVPPATIQLQARQRSLSSVSEGTQTIGSNILQQTRVALLPAADHLVRGQQVRVPSSSTVEPWKCEPLNWPRKALSNGKMQVSPQPKPSTTTRAKMQQDSSRGVAKQPAKRIKYNHLLGGSALLSLAGRQEKKS